MTTMHLAVFTTFATSRKEPLADVAGRVHDGFLAAGFGEPCVRMTLADAPFSAEKSAVTAAFGIKRVSSIERVVKRWPQLERFVRNVAEGSTGQRFLCNATDAGAVEPVDFALVQEIARGVPRSFPFNMVTLHFSAPGFSDGPELPPFPDRRTLGMLMRAGVDIGAGHPTAPGVNIKDSWWVNGRQRFVAALRVIEGDPAAKRLPPPPAPVAVVFAACGKARKTLQVPASVAPVPSSAAVSEPTATGEAIRAVVGAYRARLPELLDALPHDLPQQPEDAAGPLGTHTSGPRKPALVRAFAPMGYDCRGDSGTFTLRRRTPGNLTVRLTLDVGTWSNSLTAFIQVLGLADGQGFKATLPLPVSRRAAHGEVRGVELWGQFPIGGPERWGKVVDNLAALVAALDRSFVPEVEAISGPSPVWFQPTTA